MPPLIDVLCVAYKRPGPLTVLVQSFINQTAQNWRLAVYHDGPDADVSALMEKYASADPNRITFVSTDTRQGQYGHPLRDLAIRQTSGSDYVLLTNDDNYYVSRFIEYVTDAIGKTAADVIMFDMIHSHENPGDRRLPAYSYFPTEYRRHRIDIGSAVVRTPLAKSAGFRDMDFAGDATYFEDIKRIKPKLSPYKIPRVLFVHN